MAASEKRQKRRQQRQQLKQQQVAPQQRVAPTSTVRSGSSGSRRSNSRVAPTSPRQGQLGLRSRSQTRLNWWQQLFGETGRPPKRQIQRSRKAEVEAGLVSSRSRKLPNRRSKIQKETNRSDAQRGLVVLKPSLQGRQSVNRQVSRNRLTRETESRESVTRSVSTPSQHSKPPAASRQKSRQRKGPLSPLVYGTRLLILGIGLGVVVGTLLSIWDPANHQPSGVPQTAKSAQIDTAIVSQAPANPSSGSLTALKLAQEIPRLKTEISSIVSQNTQLSAGIFVLDLDSGAYVNLNGTSTQASASTIKIPILVAFLQDVEAGKIELDEKLTLKSEYIASGSGNMQRKKPGTKYTALETATKMITSSDNTATHMLIDRLGGIEPLNQRFREWGLTVTAIRNDLPDTGGTNTTSPKELATLMARVMQGDLLSASSRDRMVDIMRQTENRNLLPKGVGKGAKIAHKTGHIGSMLADAGIVELPNGKRYIVAAMVKRPRNHAKAQELIQKVSRAAYQYFSKSSENPHPNSEDAQAPDAIEPIELPVQSPPTTASRQMEGNRGRTPVVQD